MPILAPPGALPAAFRVICLRSARAFGRGEVVDYAFHKLSSKKCSNCTRLNDKCIPIPDYVEEEFDKFWEALVAFEGGDDSEKDALLRAVTPLGKELGNVVFVTTAGMKDTTTAQVIEASHRELVALRRGQEVQRNQLAMLLEDKEERDKEKEREREKRKGKGRSATAEFEGALGGDEGEFLE